MNMLNSTINATEESVGFDDYDDFVFGGVTYPSPTYAALGLSGETGEVIERIKKLYRKHGEEWTTEADYAEIEGVQDELGDVLWYVTRLCQCLGLSLADIAQYNMEKLNARQGR